MQTNALQPIYLCGHFISIYAKLGGTLELLRARMLCLRELDLESDSTACVLNISTSVSTVFMAPVLMQAWLGSTIGLHANC